MDQKFSEFKESDKLLNISHICHADAVVASWSLTQEVAGSSPFNDNYLFSLNTLNSVKTFRKNSNQSVCPKHSMVVIKHGSKEL